MQQTHLQCEVAWPSVFLRSLYPYAVQAMVCYIAIYTNQTKQEQSTDTTVCVISRLTAMVRKGGKYFLLSPPKVSV